MAKSKAPPPPPPRPMTLSMSRAVVQSELEKLVGRYKSVSEREVRSEEALSEAHKENHRIGDYATTFLRKAFHDEKVAAGFNSGWSGTISMMPQPVHVRVKWLFDVCAHNISDLQSIIDQLGLYEEPENSAVQAAPTRGENVFIVHGHDTAMREGLARTVEKLGYTATILHEVPNKGKTIIEKLEAIGVPGFVVVLVTGDDLGCAKGNVAGGESVAREKLESRARQNVLFEAGLFIGLLGREYVCLLKEASVALPSDLAGLGWIAIDDGGAWRFAMAKELEAAGFSVDLNLLA
jgi:predicted nucleotide-binding protein